MAAVNLTDLLDGLAAVLLFGIPNAILIVRIGSSQPRSEGAFLARAYAATLLCRALLATLLNMPLNSRGLGLCGLPLGDFRLVFELQFQGLAQVGEGRLHRLTLT